MDDAFFDSIRSTLQTRGARAAFEDLIGRLNEAGDFHRLFEVRRLLARHEAGISLLDSTASALLDDEGKLRLENALIEACREAGTGFLAKGEIASAFRYLEMIGETEPIRAALEVTRPSDEDVSAVAELCLSRGIHPQKGIELILEHYGLCQAITAAEAVLSQQSDASLRQTVVGRLVRAVHDELVARLREELGRKEGPASSADSMAQLLGGRSWLFADDNYHLDPSHLNAIVRMSRLLAPSDELKLAIELCEYGEKLSSKYRYADAAPFEDVFEDTKRFLRVLGGEEVDAGLAHFRQKALSSDRAAVGTYPAEVYVHLLEVAGRLDEALDFADEWLADASGAILSLHHLCRKAGDYGRMAEWSRRREDPVTFLAALVEAQRKQS